MTHLRGLLMSGGYFQQEDVPGWVQSANALVSHLHLSRQVVEDAEDIMGAIQGSARHPQQACLAEQRLIQALCSRSQLNL